MQKLKMGNLKTTLRNDKKLIRDGKVAVLYSPGFGAGWSTWNENPREHMFNYRLCLAVLGESGEDPSLVAESEFPESYHGGVSDLEVEWVRVGSAFRIVEYDGHEAIEYLGDGVYVIA